MSKTTRSAPKILVYTDCRWERRSQNNDDIVIKQIKRVLNLPCYPTSSAFQVSSEALLTRCCHPYSVALPCHDKTNYLFGRIQTNTDIDEIARLADQCWRSSPGRMRCQDHHTGLRGKMRAQLTAPIKMMWPQAGVLS